MRLLIVTWLYDPHATPRAIRWKTVARQLVRTGCEVDVVTSREAGEPAFERVGGVNIYRCGGSTGSRLAGFAKGAQEGRPLARLVRRVHQATWRNLYWPDKACLWALPAIHTAKHLLSTNSYDGLITVSLPFTAHMVGYHLKKRYPSLPWLVDVGDPFSCQDASAPNNAQLHGRRNRLWEGKVFQLADHIAVTNQAMTDVYRELFPDTLTKIEVIPPVLGSDVPSRSLLRAPSAKKRLLFLGTLYNNIRNPGYLLAAFEQLRNSSPDRYELHLAGDVNDCAEQVRSFESHLSGSLFVHKNQPRAEAMRMLSEADFVINIGNTAPFQLPSKLVEYAAMGKHIINFSNCDRDSSTLFLKPYPGALSIRQTESPAAFDVERLQAFIENPPAFRNELLEPWLGQFSAEAVASSYLLGLGLTSNQWRAA